VRASPNYVRRLHLEAVDLDVCVLNSCTIAATEWTEYARWCANRPGVVFPPRLACQRIRAETGMPRPVIWLSTLHPTFASVRWLDKVRA
jgi:hypothetical protein